jgi:hypothetical protein
MRVKATLSGLLIFSVLYTGASARTAPDRAPDARRRVPPGNPPLVLGHGIGRFQVGPLLAQEDFDDLRNWVVQIEQGRGKGEATVEVSDSAMHCVLPGRGCTVWYRRKLPSRVTIVYDVLCPTPKPGAEGLQPRDINNFWMASDPKNPERGLFDSERYNGGFGSYDKMHGYYASTGGGGAVANRTTRMRRYPREVDGRPAVHLALNDKDGKPGYLITPDKVMTVQLVAYDDVVQYIVDGKLNYEIARGDAIQVEDRDADGKRVQQDAVYDLERFPVYREGYFGFRMVGTHHIYTNFRVYALEPAEAPEIGPGAERDERQLVSVSSLAALRKAGARSNQRIRLTPGEYRVADRGGFNFSGSNNDIVLTGVHIEVPLGIVSRVDLFKLTGDNITWRGGTLEDTYPDGSTEVTDFGSYNQGRKYGRMNEMVVLGNDNRVIGVKMTIRGSYPYGYGNMYGIGAGSAVGLSKHCGIRVAGNRAILDGCHVKMESFGHAIYVQGGDRTTIRNCVVAGTLRPSNDCYNETDDGDLAKRFNYRSQWPEEVKGLPIPRDHMLNCTEDGIRAYKGAGHMLVENCVVMKTRGGIKLYMAKSAKVTGCRVLDCVIQGYSVPSGGVISNSSGNAAYGPLLYIHFDSHSNQRIDLKVLPSPHGLGDHPLAAIKGRGHSIKFTRADGATSKTLRPIIVGYPMRFDFLCVDYPDVPKGYEKHFAKYSPKTYRASGITIDNGTPHPVVLGKLSRENDVRSVGPARDQGTDNTVTIVSHASRRQ